MTQAPDKFNPKEPRRRMPKPVWVYPLSTVFIWGVGLVLFFEFFDAIKIIALGLLASASVAAALRPVAERIPGPRTLSAVLTGVGFIVAAVAVVAAVSWLLVVPIQAELVQWGQVKAGINGVLASWAKSLGVHQTVDLDHIGEQVVSFVTGQGLGNIVAQTAGVTTTVAVILAFVFIGSMYLLASPRGQMSLAIVGLLPPWRRPAMVGAMRDLEPQLRWWLIGTLIGMVSIGAASLAGYALVGLHWAAAGPVRRPGRGRADGRSGPDAGAGDPAGQRRGWPRSSA